MTIVDTFQKKRRLKIAGIPGVNQSSFQGPMLGTEWSLQTEQHSCFSNKLL